MIVYMNIPSEHAKQRAMSMPYGKMIVGYVCDDCIKEKDWNSIVVKEDTLRNLLANESRERWDSDLGVAVMGLHLCRHHALRRRWATDEYRQNVMSALLPVIQGDEYRRQLSTSGKYLYQKERRARRIASIEKQILDKWECGTLSFLDMDSVDLNFIKHVSGEERTPKRSGVYIYYPGLEHWLSRKVGVTEEVIHDTLFRQWLLSQRPVLSDCQYSIVVYGYAKGDKYNRYHGHVVYGNKSISFSSALELAFIVECVLANDSIYRASDDKRLVVKYTYNDKRRKYYPDFVHMGNVITEVKDSREMLMPINLEKAISCVEQCMCYGMCYRTVTEYDISSVAQGIADAAIAAWIERNK